MIRKPFVAGQFYPDSPDQLRSMIAGLVDNKAAKEKVVGLVLPHAGYVYSGAVVGATISRAEFKDTFIIMGPNHTGSGKPLSIMTQGTWKTPLGEVEIDSELSKQFLATSNHLEEDYIAHQYEHSIEVQLPFLQRIWEDPKIVPISLATTEPTILQKLGKILAKLNCLVLASSDMSHYLSQDQANLIVDFLGPDGQAALMFDTDESGQECTKECMERLCARVFVKALDISSYGKKPHHLTRQQINEIL